MQQQEPRPPNLIENARNSAYFLMWLAGGFAMSAEMFLRRRWGSRAIEGRAPLALLLMVLWPVVVYPAADPRPQWWMIGGFLLRCFYARLGGAIRARRGMEGHSKYTGWPVFKWLAPRCSEAGFKRVGEPLIVLAAAAVIHPHSEMVASYLLLCAASLFVTVTVSGAVERAQLTDMRDAMLEQRTRGERFQRMCDDL